MHVREDKLDEATVWVPQHVHRRHPERNEWREGASRRREPIFHEVARSLAGTQHVLVVGPSTAKLDFSRYLHKHEPALEARIVGIETVDHPTDKQLAAYAKQYFHVSSREPDTHDAPGAAPSAR